MSGMDWALLLRPFVALLLFGAIVIPIELVLQRLWPDTTLKRILFDRTLRDRRPVLFTGAVIGGYALFFGIIWFLVR